jgi:hypothetical protein
MQRAVASEPNKPFQRIAAKNAAPAEWRRWAQFKDQSQAQARGQGTGTGSSPALSQYSHRIAISDARIYLRR